MVPEARDWSGVNDMATKTKAAGAHAKNTSDAAEKIETAMKNGAEAMTQGFEKAVKGYDRVIDFNRETVEAYLKAANAAGKGLEALHGEFSQFSRQQLEDAVAAAKAVLASKTAHQAFEIQSDFAKAAFDAYMGRMTKMGEMLVSVTKDTFEPIQGRVQAWVEAVQGTRAA